VASAARAELDTLVEQIVEGQNQALMAAILDEFGNRVQAAGTRDDQNDINDLLWYFKERVMTEMKQRPQGDSCCMSLGSSFGSYRETSQRTRGSAAQDCVETV
jgi:hypothetical protein